MPKKFDEIPVHYFDGVFVASQNKYKTKEEFIKAIYYDCNWQEYNDKEIKIDIKDIKEVYFRGCVCSSMYFEGFHWEETYKNIYLNNKYPPGSFKCWRYGDWN